MTLETQKHSQQSYSNDSQLQNNTFMQMRLDTTPILKRIENFLSAKRNYLVKQGDDYIMQEEIVGEPFANNVGINNILNNLQLLINNQVVQGNFKEDHYFDFIKRIRKELARSIVLNCYDWDIEEKYLDHIINSIMHLIEPFMTRTIGNKERDSYMNQFQSREVISQPKNSAFSLFGAKEGQK